jgi:hypothetical protein
VNETDKERVISRVLNAEVTIFSYDPDSCAMVGDLKMGRYDAIFTDRRCLFFPVKSGDFWKHADWAMIGRLGGVVGVAIAHSAAALTDGVKSTLKDNEPYLISELEKRKLSGTMLLFPLKGTWKRGGLCKWLILTLLI